MINPGPCHPESEEKAEKEQEEEKGLSKSI